MKVEIEFKECEEKFMALHQEQFTLQDEKGDIAASWNTIIPGGSPLVKIEQGKNKGKRFFIETKTLQEIVEKLMGG